MIYYASANPHRHFDSFLNSYGYQIKFCYQFQFQVQAQHAILVSQPGIKPKLKKHHREKKTNQKNLKNKKNLKTTQAENIFTGCIITEKTHTGINFDQKNNVWKFK